MAKSDIYGKWLEQRRRGRVPDGFTGLVMRKVMEAESPERSGRRGHGSPGPFVRLALVASMSTLGLFRLAAVAWSLLCP